MTVLWKNYPSRRQEEHSDFDYTEFLSGFTEKFTSGSPSHLRSSATRSFKKRLIWILHALLAGAIWRKNE